MRKLLAPTISLSIALLPHLASAVDIPVDVSHFIGRVLDNIVNPLVLMAFALSTFYMLYSVIQYIYNRDKMDQKKLKDALIYGVVGVAVMASVFGFLSFVASSLRNSGIQIQDIPQ